MSNAPTPMPSEPNRMYCFTCGYELGGVPAGPCPECGRVFDPARPETWDTGRSVWLRRHIVAIALMLATGPFWTVGGIGMEYSLAWIVLGHQPRMSLDDPKSVSMVGTVLHQVVGVSIMASPVMTLVAVVLSVAGLMSRVRRAIWAGVLAASVLAWPAALAVNWLVLSPLGITDWWFD